ncbi:unnamed protein product [Knipowitschia caucasica]|uniref:Uncharacterized protein n=1 Tax=Knipowitschia caucasica TaxID=637954 RepID=A0AAV2MGX9_KNICA
MTAGTVVITGGILATVILLFIIAVLCYCRLQYYCCKSNGSDSGSLSQQHLACDSVCSPPAAPSTGGPRYCPSCSPRRSPFYIRTSDNGARNGGERVTYMPTHFENPALAPPLPHGQGSVLRSAPWSRPPEIYTNTRAVSTEV